MADLIDSQEEIKVRMRIGREWRERVLFCLMCGSIIREKKIYIYLKIKLKKRHPDMIT